MIQNLSGDILNLIISFTDLQTLFNFLRLNKQINQRIKENCSFSTLEKFLLSKTKKLSISKYSNNGSIIYGLLENFRQYPIKVKKKTIKIGGPTYQKMVSSGEMLDIFKVEELLKNNNFLVIIRGPIRIDKKIVDSKYMAAKVVTIRKGFIHYDPSMIFEFEDGHLDLFLTVRGKKNIKNLILNSPI